MSEWVIYFEKEYDTASPGHLLSVNRSAENLAHDDDWYCKLYVRNYDDFLNVVTRKIEKYVGCELNSKVSRKGKKNFHNKERILFLKTSGIEISEISLQVKQKLYEKWSEGLFIDLSGMQIVENKIIIKTYIIGKFNDMDEMFNNIEQHKENATQINDLCLSKNEWTLL